MLQTKGLRFDLVAPSGTSTMRKDIEDSTAAENRQFVARTNQYPPSSTNQRNVTEWLSHQHINVIVFFIFDIVIHQCLADYPCIHSILTCLCAYAPYCLIMCAIYQSSVMEGQNSQESAIHQHHVNDASCWWGQQQLISASPVICFMTKWLLKP